MMYLFCFLMRVVVCLTVIAPSLQAQNCCDDTCQFKRIAAFGDSATDIGNAPARPESVCPSSSGNYAPDTSPGCCGSNKCGCDGGIWVQDLARALCIIIRPSSQGGTDYAFSGAATTTAAEVLAQARSYIQSPNAPFCNTLFAVRPSIQDFIGEMVLNNVTPTDAFITGVVDTTVETVVALHDAGARYIVLPNMINLGNLPIFVVDGPTQQALGTQVSRLFNAELLRKTNELCFDVIQVDAFGLEREVFAYPECFGFTNLTTGCCCPCPLSGEAAQDCCISYYWDLIDQSARAHQLFSDYVLSVLNGPICYGHITEIPLETIYAHNVTLAQQLAPVRSVERNCPTFFMGANYCPLLQQPTNKCCFTKQEKATSFSLLAGALYPWTQGFLSGLSYGFSRPISRKASCCKFDTMMHTVSLFSSTYARNYYVNLFVNGSAFHTNVQRMFNLGSKRTKAVGSTHGNQVGVTVEGTYYVIQGDTIQGGILADIEFNRIKTKGYTESNACSANLTYEDRIRYSAITGLGVQMTGTRHRQCSDVTVNLYSMVQKDWKLHKDTIQFHVASLPCSHASVPFCLPYRIVMACGLDTSVSYSNGLVATAGFHAKIGAKKYYNTVASFALACDF